MEQSVRSNLEDLVEVAGQPSHRIVRCDDTKTSRHKCRDA
jgi:hypothetical protein